MTANGMITPQGCDIRKCYPLPLEDLSGGGLRYTSMFAFPLGTRLALVLKLNDSPLGLTAEVVRARKNGEGRYDIGCKFVVIDHLDRENIIRYVTRATSRSKAPIGR